MKLSLIVKQQQNSLAGDIQDDIQVFNTWRRSLQQALLVKAQTFKHALFDCVSFQSVRNLYDSVHSFKVFLTLLTHIQYIYKLQYTFSLSIKIEIVADIALLACPFFCF